MKIEKWQLFLVWLVLSLLAIAQIGDNLILGVGIAVGGGVLFGAINWYVTRNISRRPGDE